MLIEVYGICFILKALHVCCHVLEDFPLMIPVLEIKKLMLRRGSYLSKLYAAEPKSTSVFRFPGPTLSVLPIGAFRVTFPDLPAPRIQRGS